MKGAIVNTNVLSTIVKYHFKLPIFIYILSKHTLYLPPIFSLSMMYSVKQSDRNSSKTAIFHKPTTYEQRVQTNSEQKITFSRHEYGQIGVFRNKMISLVQKLQPLEKCQFSNCSHLIASHCIQDNYYLQQLYWVQIKKSFRVIIIM